MTVNIFAVSKEPVPATTSIGKNLDFYEFPFSRHKYDVLMFAIRNLLLIALIHEAEKMHVLFFVLDLEMNSSPLVLTR